MPYMRRTLSYALIVACASANAQVDPQWMASRFGLNLQLPSPNAGATMNDFANPSFRETGTGDCHTSAGVMTKAGNAIVTTKRKFNDPKMALWADVLSLTDKLPGGTWVRTDAMLEHHFPSAYVATPNKMDRVTEGVITRMMMRSSDPKQNLNVLFVMLPTNFPTLLQKDWWSEITVDPFGKPLAKPLLTGEPWKRDIWRPVPALYPYIKESVQKFVSAVNNKAAYLSKLKYGQDFQTYNFLEGIAFQLGNEAAGGHPGGSQKSLVGSWAGLGDTNEGTMGSVNFGVSDSVRAALGVPATFKSNPLLMPAFSYLNEGRNVILPNGVYGKLRNFQQGGSLSASFNELTSYSKELADKKWATMTSRRTLHFRSPTLRWRFFTNDFFNVENPMYDTLFHGPGDTKYGRWETPQEYAKRWVDELERAVDGVASLPMPMRQTVVDITETYFPMGDLGVADHNANMLDANGKNLTYTDKTLAQVRELGRTCRMDAGRFKPLDSNRIAPTRQQLLIAVRDELYQRDVVQKNLNKNVGRIYLWTGSSADQRFNTGLNAGATGDVVGYNPWDDMRLSPSELKAFWNIQ